LSVVSGGAEAGRGPEAQGDFPTRFLVGTGPKVRESRELARLSPMTKTWFLGTVAGPKEWVLGAALSGSYFSFL
jgi:hypothetical protein